MESATTRITEVTNKHGDVFRVGMKVVRRDEAQQPEKSFYVVDRIGSVSVDWFGADRNPKVEIELYSRLTEEDEQRLGYPDDYQVVEDDFAVEVDLANAIKPPLGIKPQKLHDEERLLEIISAIDRYMKEVLAIPSEWIEEHNEIVERIRNKK